MEKSKCPLCQNEIDKTIDVCPKCGYQLKYVKDEKELKSPIEWMAILMMLNATIKGLFIVEGITKLFTGIINISIFIVDTSFLVLMIIGFGSIGRIYLTGRKRELLSKNLLRLCMGYVISIFSWIFFHMVYIHSVYYWIKIIIFVGKIYVWKAIYQWEKNPDNIKKRNQRQCLFGIIATMVFLECISISNGWLLWSASLAASDFITDYIIVALYVYTQIPESADVYIQNSLTKQEKTFFCEKRLVEADNYKKKKRNGYIKISCLILFTCMTFGLYIFVWIYRIVGFFNDKQIGKKKSKIIQVLLCMFVPFYIIYWMYKQSKLVREYSNQVGNNCNDMISVSVLLILVGLIIVPIIMIQNQINKNLIKEKSESIEASSGYRI